jgi:hypothetical protein
MEETINRSESYEQGWFRGRAESWEGEEVVEKVVLEAVFRYH